MERARALAARVAARVGGIPAVRTLAAVLETYDRAGGGLLAGGLAYGALLAILPGLLLVVSVAGLFFSDPARQAALVDAIAVAVPPLEEFARIALQQVSAGAVPSSLIAIVGLGVGVSAFYAGLDDGFARIFREVPVRNFVERWLRGFVATGLLIVLPVTGVIVGVILSSVVDALFRREEVPEALQAWLGIGSPLLTVLLFTIAVGVVFRLVPARPVPLRSLAMPAVATGLAIGVFTEVFAIIAPLMLRTAAFYGTFIAIFALLTWLSISLNVMLIGASWLRVRMLAEREPGEAPSTGPA